MNKRGYLKTLEALFAIIIFLIALFGILSLQQTKAELKPEDIELMQDTILNEIEHNQTFRSEIMAGSPTPFIDQFVSDILPNKLDFDTVICINPENCPLPDNPNYAQAKQIYADSIIIRESESRLFILYLWNKVE